MELLTEFALDIAKRKLRATTIMREFFTPHAFIPHELDLKKIIEAIKELGLENEIPDIPDELPEGMEKAMALAQVPLDFGAKDKSLDLLGHLLSMADVSNVVVICDMKLDGEDAMDVLSVANINLKASDEQVLIPYARESEDVAFGEKSIYEAVEEDIRDKVIEGFLKSEAKKFIEENPDGDIDSYVDNLPNTFPNIEGALNTEEADE